jgi:hypothetical protein
LIRFQDIFGELDLKLALENLIKRAVDLDGLPRPERDRQRDPDIVTNGDQDRAVILPDCPQGCVQNDPVDSVVL